MSTATVKVKIINTSGFELPAYATQASAGMDVRAAVTEAVTLPPLGRALIPTGLRIALPEGYECQIRPRSGLALRSGITILNSPGTIDADYRGEIGIIIINLGAEPFTVNPGERIAQMVIAPVTQAVWEPCARLDDTDRGAGGFGHTGVK